MALQAEKKREGGRPSLKSERLHGREARTTRKDHEDGTVGSICRHYLRALIAGSASSTSQSIPEASRSGSKTSRRISRGWWSGLRSAALPGSGWRPVGGYERAVRDVLCAAGLEVHILDPARVRHFAKAKGRRAKPAPIDARVIAEFPAPLVDTPPVTVEPAREDLAKLIRMRRLLVDKRADMTKAIKDLPDAARTVVETALASLATAITELEELIDRQAGADAALAKRVEALCSAPGIGQTTAVAVAVLLSELGRISGCAIAALLGVAPFANDSGDRKGERHIAGGR